jgi:hypothetical protein
VGATRGNFVSIVGFGILMFCSLYLLDVGTSEV